VKNQKKVQEFIHDQEAAAKAQALLDQQEKNFYSYAEQCIGQWQAQGKNVKPIIMELKNYKKRVV
jgi:predicted DNA-binding WGR domain protein